MALSSETALLLGGAVLACALYWNHQITRAARRLPLPPGPKKLPIIGNLFDIPTSYEWETYAAWSQVYNSDILHLEVAGKSIILLNSQKVATDLFDQRSSIYSSRARFIMVNELIGFDWLFGFMPYAEAWKERRRLFQHHFHPLNKDTHQPTEREFTHKLLHQLLSTPEDFMSHIRHMVGAVAITLGYGLNIRPKDDPYVEIAEQALVGLAAGAAPGAFLVESLPILKYVPAWLPGAGFKRKAAVWRTWTRKMVEVPFKDAYKGFISGTANPQSFTSLCLSSLDESKDVAHQTKVIQEAAASFFVGGADTTVSSLNTFMLAMTCYPEVQAKAKKELDRVLGPNTLPDFNDEGSLPYISAVVKEAIRWQAVTPLGIPHYLTEDDEYNGYFLPKHSVVIGNVWAMLHDKEDYPNPFVFNPDRFLTPDGKLNSKVREPNAAFGFGRRVCPGKHIANSTMFLVIASILTLFDISKAVDEDGNVIEPTMAYVSSMVSHPEPFKCSIKPRSPAAEALIRALNH